MSAARDLLGAAVSAASDIGHLFSFIVTTDAEPGALVALVNPGEDPPADAFIGRDVGALGVRVSWSPDETRAMQECWVITAVARGEPAEAAVGPYDGEWFRLNSLDFPWFVAATAGGIRASIERGKPLTAKRTKDARLFGRVADGEPPPADANGLI